MQAANDPSWAIRLFKLSVLKQRKLHEIEGKLGRTEDLECLDIGSDNGVISYLLRQRGGTWTSADLNATVVDSIRSLVHERVYQIDGGRTPFAGGTFDRVVIIDFLEHIPDDAGFLQELHRILKPDGGLVINVPHVKKGWLRRLRYALGQTDEKHGHLRPGYRLEDLRRLLSENFELESATTYSKFFSELVDTLIVFAVSRRQKSLKGEATKGLVVTNEDMRQNQKMLRLYSLIYPFVWFFAKLDGLLFFTSGYSLIVRARACPASQGEAHKT